MSKKRDGKGKSTRKRKEGAVRHVGRDAASGHFHTKASGRTVTHVIEQIRKGVGYTVVEKLRDGLDLSTGEMGELIDITPRTLARRRKEGRLAKDESERAIRITRLWEKALDVFDGDRERAQRWFKTPAFSLGEKTPLEFADTEPGAQEVYNLLGRIEHGLGA